MSGRPPLRESPRQVGGSPLVIMSYDSCMLPVTSAKDLESLERTAERLASKFSNWSTRRAAHRLVSAGLVLQSLNAYDYECRAAFGLLLSFSAEWPEARRVEAACVVDNFVTKEVIYRILQRNLRR